jgi:hypothetical protein
MSSTFCQFIASRLSLPLVTQKSLPEPRDARVIKLPGPLKPHGTSLTNERGRFRPRGTSSKWSLSWPSYLDILRLLPKTPIITPTCLHLELLDLLFTWNIDVFIHLTKQPMCFSTLPRQGRLALQRSQNAAKMSQYRAPR